MARSINIPPAAFQKSAATSSSFRPVTAQSVLLEILFRTRAAYVANTLPVVGSVVITPDPAYTDNDLTATPSGWQDPDRDTEAYRYKWQKYDGDSWQDIPVL